jgi:hypothetical protein
LQTDKPTKPSCPIEIYVYQYLVFLLATSWSSAEPFATVSEFDSLCLSCHFLTVETEALDSVTWYWEQRKRENGDKGLQFMNEQLGKMSKHNCYQNN